MFTDVTMWGIYIRFFSSRGYSFMFTNSAYEMSMGFSNIRGLTLSTWIFINYIRRHHMWNLIFKGKERANNIFINKDTSKVYLGKILINKKGKLFPCFSQTPLIFPYFLPIWTLNIQILTSLMRWKKILL